MYICHKRGHPGACGGTSLKRFRVPTAGIQCQGCDTDPQESTGQRGRHTTTKGRGADGTVSGVEGLQMRGWGEAVTVRSKRALSHIKKNNSHFKQHHQQLRQQHTGTQNQGSHNYNYTYCYNYNYTNNYTQLQLQTVYQNFVKTSGTIVEG